MNKSPQKPTREATGGIGLGVDLARCARLVVAGPGDAGPDAAAASVELERDQGGYEQHEHEEGERQCLAEVHLVGEHRVSGGERQANGESWGERVLDHGVQSSSGG